MNSINLIVRFLKRTKQYVEVFFGLALPREKVIGKIIFMMFLNWGNSNDLELLSYCFTVTYHRVYGIWYSSLGRCAPDLRISHHMKCLMIRILKMTMIEIDEKNILSVID